jgi:hypothetical protein
MWHVCARDVDIVKVCNSTLGTQAALTWCRKLEVFRSVQLAVLQNTSSQTDTNLWLLYSVLLYTKPHGAYCCFVEIIVLYFCPSSKLSTFYESRRLCAWDPVTGPHPAPVESCSSPQGSELWGGGGLLLPPAVTIFAVLMNGIVVEFCNGASRVNYNVDQNIVTFATRSGDR